jgi:hypothetical protein
MKHTKHWFLALFTVLLAGGCGLVMDPNDYDYNFQSPYTNEDYPPGTVINGYTLPPEPDHEENDKTLLGIDTNHNGIRDDVERYIIIKENEKPNKYPKVWTSVMLQYARAQDHMMQTDDIEWDRRWNGCMGELIRYLESKGANFNNGFPYYEGNPDFAKSYKQVDELIYLNTKKRRDFCVDCLYNGHTVFDFNATIANSCDDDLFGFGELP